MAHAFLITAESEKGIGTALAYSERQLGLVPQGNPDVTVLRFRHLSVEDARTVGEVAATAPLGGNGKLVVLAAERLFHEAQNALLKLFEEPPQRTTLMLIVPTAGIVLPTLRSRLCPLEGETGTEEAHPFVAASAKERAAIVAKLLDRAKSSKDEEKQAARAEALRIVEDLTRAAYEARKAGSENRELAGFLDDLARVTPILHERSAPLKLIFEHLLITTPKDLVH